MNMGPGGGVLIRSEPIRIPLSFCLSPSCAHSLSCIPISLFPPYFSRPLYLFLPFYFIFSFSVFLPLSFSFPVSLLLYFAVCVFSSPVMLSILICFLFCLFSWWPLCASLMGWPCTLNSDHPQQPHLWSICVLSTKAEQFPGRFSLGLWIQFGIFQESIFSSPIDLW